MSHFTPYYLLLLVIIGTFFSRGSSQEISDQCLGCLCHASSGCNKDQGCTEAGVCGPFLITWGFWSDAGKLVVKGSNSAPGNAYQECTTDLYCSSEVVRSYMRKFAKDCNGDGVINCEDYARIHRNGPGGCENNAILQTEFYQKFSACSSRIQPN